MGSKMTLLISALLKKHISVFFFLYLALSLSFLFLSPSFSCLSVMHHLSLLVLCLSPSGVHLSLAPILISFLPHLLFFTISSTHSVSFLSLPLVACRHLCKSPSCGRRFLWARPFGSLSLCLLEAVLAHLEKQGTFIQC